MLYTSVIVLFLRLKWDRIPPGYTPLMSGSSYDHQETVKYLVGVKANIEAKDNDGGQQLQYCQRLGSSCSVGWVMVIVVGRISDSDISNCFEQ